jgi:DNA-binding LacI/PurR family transcriptional regulator
LATSIKDVAKHSGVSIATVSHVLNGTRHTRPQTRERVLAAIHDLGYAQNQAARNLARGTSTLLGVIVSDVRNPFFPEITAAFQEQALVHDMDALVINTNYDAQRTLNSVRRLIGMQVPGVAIFTSQIDETVVDLLAQRRVASVYLDLGRVDTAVSNIVLEYAQGIAASLQYLWDLGHRRISYIGGPPHLLSIVRRKEAFLQSAARLGIEIVSIVDSDFTVKGAYQACARVLQGNRPTAIMTGNDLTAIGVLHRAYEAGLCIPEDLSVVGFDDILLAEYTQPALTTVAVPRQELGKLAFETLWAMMADPDLVGRELRLPTQLRIRQSTAPPLS